MKAINRKQMKAMHSARTGFTLIELLVVITFTASVVGLAALGLY